jgi:hypothetical protein
MKFINLIFFCAFLVSAMFISCDKNDDPPIQTGYVNFTIYPNSVEYLDLNSPGGWVYVSANQPSRGIIIYRFSLDEFRAFERTPTYKSDSCCITEPVYYCTRLIVDPSALFVLDTCTGSKYLILDGSVVEGPATYPLLQYNTRYDGEALYVFN